MAFRNVLALDQRAERRVRSDDPRWLNLGVTQRMLDYWTRLGLLVADDPAPGSGVARNWPESELGVADRIVRLRRVGMDLHPAAALARRGPGRHAVADGMAIEVS
jgi:hypothetical protein